MLTKKPAIGFFSTNLSASAATTLLIAGIEAVADKKRRCARKTERTDWRGAALAHSILPHLLRDNARVHSLRYY